MKQGTLIFDEYRDRYDIRFTLSFLSSVSRGISVGSVIQRRFPSMLAGIPSATPPTLD